jgi:hypothetical protein
MDSCNLLYRFKDDILISDKNQYGTLKQLTEDDQILYSYRVNEKDNGTYTCKVSDGINEIQRKIQLYVLRKCVWTLFILELRCMSVIKNKIVLQICVVNFVDWYVCVCLLE